MPDPWMTALPDRPFPYSQADYEDVPCNLCGATDAETVATRDRNGLRVRSVICRRCGLIYLSPRMTAPWYQRYYEVEYRRQMAAYKRGRGLAVPDKVDLDRIYASQVRRGAWLVNFLCQHGVRPPQSVLEIGCSTGGLLRALADAFGARIQGVEPSPEECDYAERRGVPVYRGLFEEFHPSRDDQFDLVVCTQAFNHLLNPRRVAEQARRCLARDGVFFLECQNFFNVCQIRDAVYQAVQIDHVYMFVPDTLQAMLKVAGFEVIPDSVSYSPWRSAPSSRATSGDEPPSLHIRLLARPGVPDCQPSSTYAEVRNELMLFPNHSPVRVALRRLGRKIRNRLGRHMTVFRSRKRTAELSASSRAS